MSNKIIISFYFLLITIASIVLRRLNLIDDNLIDVSYFFLLTIPFARNARNLLVLYFVVYATSFAYFKNTTPEQTLVIGILSLNAILAFICILFSLKKPSSFNHDSI